MVPQQPVKGSLFGVLFNNFGDDRHVMIHLWGKHGPQPMDPTQTSTIACNYVGNDIQQLPFRPRTESKLTPDAGSRPACGCFYAKPKMHAAYFIHPHCISGIHTVKRSSFILDWTK
jgi:hypothetical protein